MVIERLTLLIGACIRTFEAIATVISADTGRLTRACIRTWTHVPNQVPLDEGGYRAVDPGVHSHTCSPR